MFGFCLQMIRLLGLCALGSAFFLWFLAGAAEASKEKLFLISMIEDRLAQAYTMKAPNRVPDFSTLDEIYPRWHGGDPD